MWDAPAANSCAFPARPVRASPAPSPVVTVSPPGALLPVDRPVDEVSTNSHPARLCVHRDYLAGTGTDRKGSTAMSLLNVEEAAERLATTPRFVRRLIAERRITFVKLGRHVRIDTADLDAYVAAGRVEPTDRRLEGSAP